MTAEHHAGDKQPDYRPEAVERYAKAARVRRQFARSMQSIERAVSVTPAEFDRLQQRVLDLAAEEEL